MSLGKSEQCLLCAFGYDELREANVGVLRLGYDELRQVVVVVVSAFILAMARFAKWQVVASCALWL